MKQLAWRNLRGKKWKELKFSFKVGSFFGTMVGAIVFTLAAVFFLSTPLINQNVLELGIKSAFSTVATTWQNDRAVQSISYLCGLPDDDMQKLDCVRDFVCRNYNYVEHDIGNMLRPSAEDFVKDGGVCRDVAVLYQSVFNNLQMSNELVIISAHVYNKVSINAHVYRVDGCDIVRLG